MYGCLKEMKYCCNVVRQGEAEVSECKSKPHQRRVTAAHNAGQRDGCVNSTERIKRISAAYRDYWRTHSRGREAICAVTEMPCIVIELRPSMDVVEFDCG